MARARMAPPAISWRRFLPAVLLVVGLSLLLLAIVELGKFTRSEISGWDRYTVDFAAIECTAPPVQKRAEFLGEVQALSKLPPRLQLLDPDLAALLAQAFARHPYVDKVEQVTLLPAHKIEVRLGYRIPVLEVMLSDRDKGTRPASPAPSEKDTRDLADDPSWFVDGKGVLLPRKKLSEPLPLLLVTTGPVGRAGEPWGSARVEAAACTAALLGPHRAKFNLKVFETRGTELVLSTAGGTRVLWGHAPGAESAEEAKAAVKLERLLHYCAAYGGLEKPPKHYEHDVRPTTEALHRLLDG